MAAYFLQWSRSYCVMRPGREEEGDFTEITPNFLLYSLLYLPLLHPEGQFRRPDPAKFSARVYRRLRDRFVVPLDAKGGRVEVTLSPRQFFEIVESALLEDEAPRLQFTRSEARRATVPAPAPREGVKAERRVKSEAPLPWKAQIAEWGHVSTPAPKLARFWSAMKNDNRAIIVLLGGASGCGKSSVAALLGTRLSADCIISTDHVRHVMRATTDREHQDPILFASTFETGDVVVNDDASAYSPVIQGYLQQCRLVEPNLKWLIKQCAQRQEIAIFEGVHLTVELMLAVREAGITVLPFLVQIPNMDEYKSRFAGRSKNFVMDAGKNKYARNACNIFEIQEFLRREAQHTNTHERSEIVHTIVNHSLRTTTQLVEEKIVQELCRRF